MHIPFPILSLAVLAACAVRAHDANVTLSVPPRAHENIEWSTSYAFHLADDKKNLPRVLLVGDSICSGYKEEVARQLEGQVNVSYWISSYCVTSPGYLKLLDFYLDEAKYTVIHFNNGLHSLGTPVADWRRGIEAALRLIRARQPHARIVWTTSTPLKDPALTAKVRELNAAAAEIVARMGGIVTDDLFALMDPKDRAANWTDVYHHKSEARLEEAKQVVACVRAQL